MRTGIAFTVSPTDRQRLRALISDRNAPQKHVWRAEIILLSADGVGTVEIMRQTGKSKTCVWRWQERFATEGFEGLLRDKTRPSRIAPLGPEIGEQVVALSLADPPGETTHWTADMMAAEVGVSASAVRRIWKAHGLQPHRWRAFKLSNDPQFVAKLKDVVGLYVDPPAHAIVLSVDEKSQIQALDRTQPGLPLKKGRLGTMTHDYKRHGTTTLFAALNVLDGTVIGRNMQRHRHQEFIRFLNAINAQVPADKAIHVILDNYAAHKHPKVRAWLDRHQRFTFHFTPTSCSWLNAVEGFFAKLSKRRLKRGVFHSVVDLQAAINRFLTEHNQQPKPFTWTADPDKIIAAVKRGHQVLEPDSKRSQQYPYLAKRRVRTRMWAIVIQASADAMDFSQSLANRRHLPSHAKVRSTTQRRGRTSKPLALSVRLTIWRVKAAIFWSAPFSFGPA
ncbi:transposase [Sinorhizobium fredii]|nr:hypothetical protein AB395_00004343 [Sinorhizobium fredii CCBAU 45436]AWI61917.1 hypothetical protein AB395_00004392 [Sinorhizobium fredii CCBAU 45436]